VLNRWRIFMSQQPIKKLFIVLIVRIRFLLCMRRCSLLRRTWEVVPLPKKKKTINYKWIFKRKEGLSPSEPPKYKTRLVAKGYNQIPGVDYNHVFSPVVKHSSIHTFLSIVALHDLELEQLDVKTAFLHGELEDIYMDQPEGFIVSGKKKYVCKLKRSLYGLKQSPR
jgi:hypothetical protein